MAAKARKKNGKKKGTGADRYRGVKRQLARRLTEKPPKLDDELYEEELARLQVELAKLQDWVRKKGLRVVALPAPSDKYDDLTPMLNARFVPENYPAE